MLHKDILGINKRNILYVKKHNPKKSIRLVDDKYKTKSFLSQRGIPVGETFKVIKDKLELLNFDFSKLPSDDFVIKPNRGSKGRGIFIVHRLKIRKKVELSLDFRILKWLGFDVKHYNNWYKISGERIDDWHFKKKLLMILDGNYTLGNRNDQILIEEKLVPGNGFETFCKYGLADIRVIVANLVPVAAMVRVPTKISGGKANLAQGGIGLGLDIVTGRVKSLMIGKQYYDNKFPDEYQHLQGYQIPFWSDILQYSANTQYFVNLGFVGIDWVITDEGPKLLEVNGKAGLEIQNISLLPLAKVLHKIIDLDTTTPQKGVEVSKALFSNKKVTGLSKTKVIYLSQKGTLICESKDKNQEQLEVDVVVEVNMKKKRNYISNRLASKIKGYAKYHISLFGSDIKLTNVNLFASDDVSGYRIQLGTNVLEKLYIKPIHQFHPIINFINPKNIIKNELDELQILDQKIYEIGKKINISKILKPINYLDEFDKFVSKKGRYNPMFEYNFPSNSDFVEWETGLKKLYDEHKQGTLLKSNFASIFYEKIEELFVKIDLLKAYKDQNFDSILANNILLFGDFDEELLSSSQKIIATTDINHDEKILGKKVRVGFVVEQINAYIKEHGLKGVRLKFVSNPLSRISVGLGNTCTVNLSTNAIFGTNELSAQIEHEIGVHVTRFLNGKSKGWYLLSRGTGYYNKYEEGLAIYLAEKKYKEMVPEYYNSTIYRSYYLNKQAQFYNFHQLVDIVNSMNLKKINISQYAMVFNKIIKLKRGIENTSIVHPGSIFMKGKIYLEGYNEIKKWLEGGGNLEDLMLGKVKISDLDYIL